MLVAYAATYGSENDSYVITVLHELHRYNAYNDMVFLLKNGQIDERYIKICLENFKNP